MVAEEEVFFQVIKWLAVQIPTMAILLLGVVLAVANWSKYPRAALLSFLGFATSLGLIIAFGVFFFFWSGLQFLFDSQILVLTVLGLRSFLAAGAYLLLIFAIYVERKPRAPMPSVDPNRSASSPAG